MVKKIYNLIALLYITSAVNAQYISEVLEYTPAPGQFINSSPWGVPKSANSLIGGVMGSMSLGAFGGYTVFKFENPVENHSDNPFGVDFTILGNPLDEWSEQGIVYVMKDENVNGLPDDIWYELAGSEYFFSSTIKGYEITYTNPNQAAASDVPWSDNQGNSGYVLANGFHNQPYYPLVDSFPSVNPVEYTLSGTRVADEVDRTIPTYIKSYRKAFGYVDNQLRGAAPYTVPDNPYTYEKENSGGDAFDIDWAVDANGEYVNLDEIDFIKVQNGVLADAGWLGEISTEITGAVVVSPDASISGELDMIIIKNLPDTIRGNSFQIEAFAYHKGRWNKDKTLNWSSNLGDASVNETNLITFTSSGEITLTASLSDRPEITATVSTVLVYDDTLSSIAQNNMSDINIYPNPASDNIYMKGLDNVSVEIYNIMGNRVLIKKNYSGNQPISVAQLMNGIYIVKINATNTNKTIQFIKK